MGQKSRTQRRRPGRSLTAAGAGSALHPAASDSLRRFAADARGAYSEATISAWKADGLVWSAWCEGHGLPVLTADPRQVARFIDDMAATRKPATIGRYCSSIARLHTAAGLADPTADPVAKLAKRRTRRVAGVRQRQARGIMENDVAAIIATTPTNTIGLRDIALLLVGRDMLARRSELAALEVSDLDLDAGTAIIRRSKTDQYGEGAILYLAPRTRGFVRRYLAEAGIVDGCVFRPLSRGGNVRGDSLDARDVARIFRRIVDRTPGLDPVGVSGHSVRIGMAQDLVADGVDLPSLMQAGRWRSPRMPARYGEKLAAGHNAVARWYERRGR